MPQLDMPLSKLQEYMGRTPCPADFDAFWEKSLAEMNAIDPKPVFTPHPFKSNCADLYELRFTSTKGAVIFAKVAVPKNVQGKVPAVLMFHGLGGDGGSYRSLMAYASQGFVVASMDCRGQAGLSQDVGTPTVGTMLTPFVRGLDGEPENLLCRDLFLDTLEIAVCLRRAHYKTGHTHRMHCHAGCGSNKGLFGTHRQGNTNGVATAQNQRNCWLFHT